MQFTAHQIASLKRKPKISLFLMMKIKEVSTVELLY